MFRFFAAILAMTLIALTAPAATWYVDVAATGAGTGDSWTSAFTDIQSAVTAAAGDGGGDVWVASGSYVSASDPVVTMASGVNLYGGFLGGESALSERGGLDNPTSIDGEGARRCVIGADNATLDGFFVINGNLLGHGGGMCNIGVSPTVSNCVFYQNTVTGTGLAGGRAGGMYNQECATIIANCLFLENTTSSGGAGMYNYLADVTVTDCYFSKNVAALYYSGGGMFNSESSPTVTNCIFDENEGYTGAAIGFYRSSATVTNSTFSNNTSTIAGGGALHANSAPAPTLTNCIVWGNTNGSIYNTEASAVVSYSLVEGGYAGTGNIDAGPRFAGTSDFHLQETSPCLDAGDDTAVTVSTDYDGRDRISGRSVDMGAYETAMPVSGGIALAAAAAAIALTGARLTRRVGE